MTTYTWYADPGHAWLRVTRKELRALEIDALISSFSYMSKKGHIAYLEEDCDAPVFIDKWEIRHGQKFHAHRTVNSRLKESSIRNLEPFISGEVVPCERCGRLIERGDSLFVEDRDASWCDVCAAFTSECPECQMPYSNRYLSEHNGICEECQLLIAKENQENE